MLRKISGNTSLVITSDFIRALYELLVINSKKDTETEVFAKWIKKRIRKDTEPAFVEIYKTFYLESFSSEELATKLTKSAFGIFKLLMIKCNPIKVVKTDKRKIHFLVETVDPGTLQGMEFLWEVIYRNTNGDVFDKAVILLVMMYVNLSPAINRNEVSVKLIG